MARRVQKGPGEELTGEKKRSNLRMGIQAGQPVLGTKSEAVGQRGDSTEHRGPGWELWDLQL